MSESKSVCKKRTLKTFSTFEEANEADAQAMAQLSPEEHLKNATERIQKIFEDELEKTCGQKNKTPEMNRKIFTDEHPQMLLALVRPILKNCNEL